MVYPGQRIEEEDQKDDQHQPEENLDDIIILMLRLEMCFLYWNSFLNIFKPPTYNSWSSPEENRKRLEMFCFYVGTPSQTCLSS
jgi:hypothetical protein